MQLVKVPYFWPTREVETSPKDQKFLGWLKKSLEQKSFCERDMAKDLPKLERLELRLGGNCRSSGAGPLHHELKNAVPRSDFSEQTWPPVSHRSACLCINEQRLFGYSHVQVRKLQTGGCICDFSY